MIEKLLSMMGIDAKTFTAEMDRWKSEAVKVIAHFNGRFDSNAADVAALRGEVAALGASVAQLMETNAAMAATLAAMANAWNAAAEAVDTETAGDGASGDDAKGDMAA